MTQWLHLRRQVFSTYEVFNEKKRLKNELKDVGFVLRISKAFKNVETVKTLYFSYERSNLEYVTPIWSPFYHKYIDKLEKVNSIKIIHQKFALPLW